MDASTRRRLLAKLSAAVANSARTAGGIAVLGGRWLVDLFVDIAPRIPVRDAETLRDHYDGLTGEALADQLVADSRSRNRTGRRGGWGAGCGRVGGAAPLLSMPIQVATETLVVAAIETKLVAELSEAYGVGVEGSGTAARPGLRAVVGGASRRRSAEPADVLARLVRCRETIAA